MLLWGDIFFFFARDFRCTVDGMWDISRIFMETVDARKLPIKTIFLLFNSGYAVYSCSLMIRVSPFCFISVPSFFLVTRGLFSFYDFIWLCCCCLYLTYFNKVWSDVRSYFNFPLSVETSIVSKNFVTFKEVSCCTECLSEMFCKYLLGSYGLQQLLVPAFLCLVFVCINCLLVIIGIKIFHYQCFFVKEYWRFFYFPGLFVLKAYMLFFFFYFCGFFLWWICSGLLSTLD